MQYVLQRMFKVGFYAALAFFAFVASLFFGSGDRSEYHVTTFDGEGEDATVTGVPFARADAPYGQGYYQAYYQDYYQGSYEPQPVAGEGSEGSEGEGEGSGGL